MAGIANTKGVDISYWNGDIDLSKVKAAGYKWVMIRCGFGNDKYDNDDSRFEANVKKAEALGMPWGAYFYTYSLSADQDKSELNHILRLLKGKKPTMPIAIDVEDADGYKSRNGGWNYSNVNRNAKYLLEGLAKNGYYPMLYTGFEEIENYISKDVWQKYDMWFAHWAKKCGYTGGNLSMWQYGGETNLIESNSIPGVGTIDKDMVYKDYPTIIKNGGYNGYTKPATGITLGCKRIHTYAWCKYALWQTGATNPKWTTSNKSISSIDANGVLSTSGAGTTTVTVTDGKYSASCPVTIDNGRNTGISKANLTLAKGQTEILSAKVSGVSWFSSNTNVATVVNGKVTAKTSGYATISAYDKQGASTCLVYVTNETYKPPITEAQLRQKVADTMTGWLGAVEGDSVHAEILRIYNSQPNLDYRMTTHDAWCAATVSAAWLKVGIAEYICTSVNCGTLRDKAIAKGIWVENDAYKPKIGDAIIYNWSDSGVGDNTGSADHVGMVTSVGSNSFTVTEGNTGNGVVGQRNMQVNGRYIRGFIAPNYSDIAKKVAGKITPDSGGSSDSASVPVIYTQGVAGGRWLGVIKNGADYSGILGEALVGMAAKVNVGEIEYSAHINGGGWLGTITGWNYKDYVNGYAGNGNPAETGDAIDAIKMNYHTPSGVVNKYGYYKVKYRVHVLGGDWLDWQYDIETSGGQDGYAGIIGMTIDGIEAELVKA